MLPNRLILTDLCEVIEIHTTSKVRCRPTVFLTPILLLFMLLLLIRAENASDSVRNALSVCAKTVIPSLFPFMILSNLMVRLGTADGLGRLLAPPFRRLFGLDGACASALLLGAVSGFPVGAKSILSIYREGGCSKEDAERTLAFCNNTGPAFVIAGIGGGFFGDMKIGVSLYIIQITAALAVGLLMRKGQDKKARSVHLSSSESTFTAGQFTTSVTDAAISVIHVCAFVIFFIVIADFIAEFTVMLGFSPLLRAGIVGFFEVTGGERMAAVSGSGIADCILGAAMLGWSGMSVHMQTLALTAGSGLSTKQYFWGKLLQGILSAVMAWGYFFVISM